MLKRAACVIVLYFVAMVVAGDAAGAETVDVVVDTSPVTLEKGDDGAHTANVALINTSDQEITVVPSVNEDDEGCDVKPKKNDLAAGRRGSYTFELSSACEVDGGKKLTLSLAFKGDGGVAVNPPTRDVTLKPPKDAPSPDWNILGDAAVLAIIGVIAALFLIKVDVDRLNAENDDDKHKAARKKSYLEKQRRINEARQLVNKLPHPTDETTPLRPAITGRVALKGLGTDWSFKDAWVSNATAGAAALVGIVAATDVLNAILGDDAKSVISLAAVVAGITFVLVNLGPLVLKAIGGDTGMPTVGGTIAAAIVVLLGTFFQIAALTLQSGKLVDDDLTEWMIYAGGAAIAVLVLVYTFGSFRGLLATGLGDDGAKPSDAERAAWITVRALSPSTVLPPLSPLDIAELLAADESATEDITTRGIAPQGYVGATGEEGLAPEITASIVTSVAAELSSTRQVRRPTALL